MDLHSRMKVHISLKTQICLPNYLNNNLTREYSPDDDDGDDEDIDDNNDHDHDFHHLLYGHYHHHYHHHHHHHHHHMNLHQITVKNTCMLLKKNFSLFQGIVLRI